MRVWRPTYLELIELALLFPQLLHLRANHFGFGLQIGAERLASAGQLRSDGAVLGDFVLQGRFLVLEKQDAQLQPTDVFVLDHQVGLAIALLVLHFQLVEALNTLGMGKCVLMTQSYGRARFAPWADLLFLPTCWPGDFAPWRRLLLLLVCPLASARPRGEGLEGVGARGKNNNGARRGKRCDARQRKECWLGYVIPYR